MIFYSSLRDSKSPQVSRNLLSILADLNKDVVRMISTFPLIFKSFSLCTNRLGIVLSAPITIGIIVIFIFHSFISSLARSRDLFLFSLSFNFTLQSAEMVKSIIQLVLFFVVDYH